MIAAAHNNTGSEYDIKETFTGKTDRVYGKMIKLHLPLSGVKRK